MKFSEIPSYSSNIESAWLVVEKMSREGFELLLQQENGGWAAGFWKIREPREPVEMSHGDSAPHAICLAALKAVESG